MRLTYRQHVVIVISSDAFTVMGYVSIPYVINTANKILKITSIYFIHGCITKFSVTSETIFKFKISTIMCLI